MGGLAQESSLPIDPPIREFAFEELYRDAGQFCPAIETHRTGAVLLDRSLSVAVDRLTRAVDEQPVDDSVDQYVVDAGGVGGGAGLAHQFL